MNIVNVKPELHASEDQGVKNEDIKVTQYSVGELPDFAILMQNEYQKTC